MDFEWDLIKAASNEVKHKVSFSEAATVFSDKKSLLYYDEKHSYDEERFMKIGLSFENRLITLIFTYRNGKIRIISARKSSLAERKAYGKQ